ncbi:MAG: hypothetical protein J6I49_07965 [Bacteroidales bacterium]|nr:hypothetical protein [Bacteroidales bacterium]
MMKKVFFTLAVAGMFGLAACNSNKAPEAVEENTMETVEAAACDMAEDLGETVENAAEEMAEATCDAVQEVVAE